MKATVLWWVDAYAQWDAAYAQWVNAYAQWGEREQRWAVSHVAVFYSHVCVDVSMSPTLFCMEAWRSVAAVGFCQCIAHLL